MIRQDERLEGVDPRLGSVVNALMLDVVVVTGVRDKESQGLAFAEGRSQIQWPNSKHNVSPPERTMAEAVDLSPWPVDWTKPKRFYLLAGAMIQEARKQGVPIRWGGDWDVDFNLDDQRFNDLAHFELVHGKTVT